jgi:hypothetical protein
VEGRALTGSRPQIEVTAPAARAGKDVPMKVKSRHHGRRLLTFIGTSFPGAFFAVKLPTAPPFGPPCPPVVYSPFEEGQV